MREIDAKQRKTLDEIVRRFDDVYEAERGKPRTEKYDRYGYAAYRAFVALDRQGFNIPDVYEPLFLSLIRRYK